MKFHLRRLDIRVASLTFLLAATVLLASMSGAEEAKPPARPPFDPAAPAETQFKNIQVMKGVPAGKVHDAMESIEASLGVGCDHCHVKGGLEKDDKEAKGMARKMMKMVAALNKSDFGGHNEVTCYTCHQGKVKPVATPRLEASKELPGTDLTILPVDAKQPAPTPEQLFEKYITAVGGKKAISSLETRWVRGEELQGEGDKAAVEMTWRSPASFVQTTTVIDEGKTRIFTQATDGKLAWSKSDDRPAREMDGMRKAQMAREAEFLPGAELAGPYTNKKLAGSSTVADRAVWVVSATALDGLNEKLYFDKESGLLVRRSFRAMTPMGFMPYDTTFTDWKELSGVKFPKKVDWRQPGEASTERALEMKAGVDAPAGKFAKPGK